MDNVQSIKEKLDIADFIRTYVQLSPAGKNFKGLCPFHKEKSPSFIVSPDRQIWHCFGCGAGGDLIGFLMRYENLEFFEALKVLGEKAGIDIGKVGSQDQKQLNALYEINRAAKDFFKLNLSQSQNAVEYLKSRGLKPETAAEFEIGFAPDLTDALSRRLLGAGFSVAALEKAGLVIKTETGTYRDRFRNRIMFPIGNQFGKIVGFTGRIMPGYESENIGKYVNSPETPIFNKSKILYGLDKARIAIRDSHSAVLVEGQMDFLMAWQDGVKNLVATSGTALTGEHLKSLKRIAENLILSFDTDAAGQAATERAIDLASASDLSVKVLSFPKEFQAKDPADIVQINPGVFKTFVDQARLAMEYYLDKFQIRTSEFQKLGIQDRKKNLRSILSKIKNIYSPVERSYWLREVEKESGFDEASLTEEMENLKKTESSPKEEAANGNPVELPSSRQDIISQRILSLVLNQKDLYQELAPSIVFLSEHYQKLTSYYFTSNSLSLSAELQPIADLISLRSGLEFNDDTVKNKQELTELVRQLKLEKYKSQRQEILTSISLAERNNNEAELGKVLSEFDKVSKEIHNLEHIKNS